MVFNNRPVLNPDGSVPATFYDSEYWETGAKSGKGSYNGNDYSTQLEACKYWATDTWNRWGPFENYLELGCGRGWAIWGFLNLPELKVKPVGVDFSHYAVTTAHEEVRPYLVEHDASDLSLLDDESADLIFSNDFLEHLTPEQAERCLRHCERISRKRIVHLISIGDGVDVFSGIAPEDQDQSHVNLKSLVWWGALFAKVFSPEDATGWKVFVTPNGRTIEMDVRKIP